MGRVLEGEKEPCRQVMTGEECFFPTKKAYWAYTKNSAVALCPTGKHYNARIREPIVEGRAFKVRSPTWGRNEGAEHSAWRLMGLVVEGEEDPAGR
ncbi:hypothetical protein CEXT_306241 [Caerostris extrusa]|uniref:Uncharacterized protein n=1 Tax=Caerostris extrusa TaxID=172846 RepID=A0AAV4T9F2_CAEEX|nr:hypothetical protein CEXT_306241 [Caerostris extrusa]